MGTLVNITCIGAHTRQPSWARTALASATRQCTPGPPFQPRLRHSPFATWAAPRTCMRRFHGQARGWARRHSAPAPHSCAPGPGPPVLVACCVADLFMVAAATHCARPWPGPVDTCLAWAFLRPVPHQEPRGVRRAGRGSPRSRAQGRGRLCQRRARPAGATATWADTRCRGGHRRRLSKPRPLGGRANEVRPRVRARGAAWTRRGH